VVKSKHQIAKAAFRLWVNCNRPKTGDIYRNMTETKKGFKYSLRQCRKNAEMQKANGLAAVLQADKTKKSFWQKVNNINRSSSLPTLVGGANGGPEIVNLNVYPSSHEVQMASPAVRVKSVCFCLVDIKDTDYTSTRLNVLETLCSDIILGLDFLSQHQRLIFEFCGPSPDLVVPNERTCAVAAAAVEEVRLFANLSPRVKPIATKSRRFSYEDQVFIGEAVKAAK